MQGFIVWGIFTVVVAAFCFWRPGPARVFVGLFFAAMGLGIHGTAILTDPQTYVDFARSAPIALYRDIGLAVTQPNPRAFGVFMLVFETVVSVLILSRGRSVKIGLLGAIVFLLGIMPLGLEELPNVVLAAGLAYLMTRDYPADPLSLLRTRLQWRTAERLVAAGAAPATAPGARGAPRNPPDAGASPTTRG